MIFRFIAAEKATYEVGILCRTLGVSKSGFYAWRGRPLSPRAKEDAELTRRIRQIHAGNRGVYGAPRIHAELALGYGIRCSRKRVARLMRIACLAGVNRRRTFGTTKRDPSRPSSPDLVKRRFVAAAPNRLWLADITQHPTGEGWLYLASVTDLFSRRVVGWSMGDSLGTDLVLRALNMAVALRRPGEGLVHHSDHGSQYTSLVYGQRLEAAAILGSMGTVGDALDNAPQESFHATLQTELLDRQTWRTRQELKTAVFDFIETFYNRRRRHSALGYLSPAEFERRWELSAVEPESVAS